MSTVRTQAATTTDTTSPNYTTNENKNLYSSVSPNVAEPYSTLDDLARKALRQYGDFHPGTVEGDVILMFMEFANNVIEDLRAHPYWSNVDIDYYKYPDDFREVPDVVIIAGLLYYYSLQQFSDKQKVYGPSYFSRMNQVLYNSKYSNSTIVRNTFDVVDNVENTFKSLPGTAT